MHKNVAIFAGLVVAMFCLPATAVLSQDFTGTYRTSEGRLSLWHPVNPDQYIGQYDNDGGRIVDAVRYNKKLIGFWVENSSGVRCSYARYGSYYWGRMQFDFDGVRFFGFWGYCEGRADHEWNGTREPFN